MSQDNIIQLDFSEEMKTSYRDYAVSVIRARALPDVRDGLKPVQRRILYAMKELGLSPDKPHRKSARIVGDTMGKYHPHGDSSIYDALVHMTEEYSLNLPLVDGHGNFGSIDGDGAAAMRYTEARLSPAAMTMLDNLEKGLVEFDPNFDESEKEPQVLPAMVPNLLINGTTGIAVGMATNIPTHNPGEVIDAVIACMDRPGISVQKLMDYIPGPDFPTGGIITNASELANIYETGEGKIKVRAKTVIEKGDNGRTNIVITEIPYTVSGNKTKLVESISGLMKDKVFDEIYDVQDVSSKEGIRIVIEVKKDKQEYDLYYSADGILVKVQADLTDDDYENYLPDASELPASLQQFINDKYPACRIIETETEHNRTEVDIIHENRSKEVIFDASGNWLNTHYDVRQNEVETAVMNALKTSAYADYIIDDIERYETPDQTYYLFELEKGAKEIEIKIDLSGKLL